MGQHTLDVMKFKLNQPSLIEASAGTGKTYTITNLVLRILLGSGDQQNSLDRPLPIEDLLVVTFTNTATADLRRRIYERIRAAHVLFENFLEVAKQEVKQKTHTLVAEELKKAKRATKHKDNVKADSGHAAGTEQAAEESPIAAQFDLAAAAEQNLTDEEMIEDFCERFLADESVAPQLSKQLTEFKLNVEDIARHKLKCSDTVLIQLLKQVADKDAVKQAINVLVKAERSIDNAAICTIHSFCNRTINQIYAFEANEAFSSELTNDLSEQEDESAISMWRKLFYKLDASPAVVRLLRQSGGQCLRIADPKDINHIRHEFSSVRLTQEDEGVFGYQLKNFILPGFKETINIGKEYELHDIVQRLFLWVDILDLANDGLILQCFGQWSEQYLNEALTYVDLSTAGLNLNYFDSGKAKLVKEGGEPFVQGFCLLEQVRQELFTNQDVQQTLHKSFEVLSKINQADHPLDCEELRAGLKELQELKLKELFGPEISQKLHDGAELLLNSAFDGKNKGKFIVAANNAKAKEGTPYNAFHVHFVELVSSMRQVLSRKNSLRGPLNTLLYILVEEQLQEVCEDQHLMSNDDLLLRLDRALQRPGFGDRLARLIRQRYPLAMIDEFQDTDPIQYSIFSKIYLNFEALKEKAYCYLIGDPKQSIYAFRGSDINSYLKAREDIKRLTDGKGLHTLGVNYRSSEDVIEASNAVFNRSLNPENISPFKESNIPFHDVGVSKKRNAVPVLVNEQGIKEIQGSAPDFVCLAQAWGSSFIIENMLQQDLVLNTENLCKSMVPVADILPATDVAKTKVKTKAKTKSQAKDEAVVANEAESEAEPAGASAAASAIHSKSDQVEISLPLANTYVVKFNTAPKNKAQQMEFYAKSTALLIQKCLQDGKIINKDPKEKPAAVKPSDIAVLVRSATESALVQKELQALGLSSVYFSDRSSVLFNGSEPTKESLDLLYLMEAMSDTSDRSKVMRVLGSGLLHLSAEEFLEHSSGHSFEREVMCLNKCAAVWGEYGFMPAFIQWCNAPEHQVTARLLSIINGERILTNYTQLSELIQMAHRQHSGIQAQIRWYYDTLYSDQLSFDSESTQKRLESEHEQIKILTIHKSKGLEFPIVFMPFLWRSIFKQSNGLGGSNVNATKYYSQEVNHRVLDFDVHQHLKVKNEVKLAKVKLHVEGAEQEPDLLSFLPKDYEDYEEAKELTRLLYVAITRARFANFLFIAGFKGKNDSRNKPSALMELFGLTKDEEDLSQVFSRFESHPELFTMVNGDKCMELFESAKDQRNAEPHHLVLSGDTAENQAQIAKLQERIDVLLEQAVQQGAELYKQSNGRDRSGNKGFVLVGQVPLEAKLYEQIKNLRQEIELFKVSNVPIIPAHNFESCAMSFAYEGAVDQTFNIMSYSRLTSKHDPVKLQQQGVAHVSNHDEEEDGAVDVGGMTSSEAIGVDLSDAKIEQKRSKYLGVETESGVGSLVGGNLYRDLKDEALKLEPMFSRAYFYELLSFDVVNGQVNTYAKPNLNRLVQMAWDAGYYYGDNGWMKRPSGLCFDFVRGADAGTFLHEVLRLIHFEELQLDETRKDIILGIELHGLIMNRSDLKSFFSKANLDHQFGRLTDWLIDILEAPILKGRYQNLALTDLQAQSYVPEMRFLMTSKRFNTAKVDDICQRMAYDILPEEHHDIIQSLKISQDELFGFITGSLDLACRFDLNQQGNLSFRPDLKIIFSFNDQSVIENECRKHYQPPQPHEPDYKYYVIDYKSNILGGNVASYSTNHMLEAVYAHRYDVQFLFYTVALYRFLKRRMGVEFDADKETLRQFYDQNIGGVMYLFIRGMKGDYLRRNISPGVFSLKIDFDYVYELDQLFGADDNWEGGMS